GLEQEAQRVEGPESVEGDGDSAEVEDWTGRGVQVHERPSRQSSPSTPRGSHRVTTMKARPRTKSHAWGKATVRRLFAPCSSPAPRIGPSSVPRPPSATAMAISTELAGDISLGLMIPTCGT